MPEQSEREREVAQLGSSSSAVANTPESILINLSQPNQPKLHLTDLADTIYDIEKQRQLVLQIVEKSEQPKLLAKKIEQFLGALKSTLNAEQKGAPEFNKFAIVISKFPNGLAAYGA